MHVCLCYLVFWCAVHSVEMLIILRTAEKGKFKLIGSS